MDKGLQKLIDTAGAGASVTSPDWLTQLGRLWGGKSVSFGQLCTQFLYFPAGACNDSGNFTSRQCDTLC